VPVDSTAQKLKELISTRTGVFGETPNGIDWCIKALHPSDPMTEVRGLPDKSAVPSLMMNYQSTYTLSPASGATGTWSFDSSLLPHPVGLMYTYKTDSTGSSAAMFNNSQLDGLTHRAKYESFLGFAQRWRLAYMSVTCIQDGPDLSNQGTIAVCQPPVHPRKFSAASTATSPAVSWISAPVVSYSAEDYPTFEAMQAFPNAYFNRSKEGAYVPLKLTKTCQQWRSQADDVYHSSALTAGVPTASFSVPTSTGVCNYPFIDLTRYAVSAGGVPAFGQSTSDMCNDTFAHICARNLSVATSFTFFVRAGFEIQVAPTSVLAPQLRISPMYDPVALKAYFMIARELKDAYPSEYNSIDTLWRVISSAAKTVAPFLSAIPVAGPALSAIVPMVAGVGDTIADAVKSRGAQTTSGQKITDRSMKTVVSAAELERARDRLRPASGAGPVVIGVRRAAPMPKAQRKLKGRARK
jgi:hypothetical protein